MFIVMRNCRTIQCAPFFDFMRTYMQREMQTVNRNTRAVFLMLLVDGSTLTDAYKAPSQQLLLGKHPLVWQADDS